MQSYALWVKSRRVWLVDPRTGTMDLGCAKLFPSQEAALLWVVQHQLDAHDLVLWEVPAC